jgi:CRISPR-associated protein Csb2
VRVVLRQLFPLGRFHATPWKVSPFEDLLGEWPPSPWRLARAVIARWYQWKREMGGEDELTQLDDLVAALCDSSYCFHLPVHARRGGPLRQYHPVEFGWNPPGKKRAAMRSYSTRLSQDNFWCVPRDEAGTVWWIIDGDRWTPQLLATLDRCLERLSYFGRAETLTVIRRFDGVAPERNCELRSGVRTRSSAPVLAPARGASRSDLERVTNDPLAARRIPRGAKMTYADLPPAQPAHEQALIPRARTASKLVQLAIGWNVAPEPSATARLTARFRSAVLNELLRLKTGADNTTWNTASASVRNAIADMTGKDANKKPLQGNRHAEFLVWWENALPTRLLAWRSSRPFDDDERTAILLAASRDLAWGAAGPEADAWKIRLVPLDAAVPPPPGFDGTRACVWESVTPYVPPRHDLRGGKPRASESLPNQVRRELALRDVPGSQDVEAEQIAPATWVAVHLPSSRSNARLFVGNRRGYWLRLEFREPLIGPIRLGHSSTFGLGLFKPVS